MEELLYSVNIILNLLGSADWMADFITSKGHNVTGRQDRTMYSRAVIQ